MTEIPTLAQLARQVMTLELGKIQDSEALAVAAVNVYATLIHRMSHSLGLMGSVMLFRRSLQYKKGAFIPFALALADEQSNFLNAIGLGLRAQTPDTARESSIGLLSHYFELLATIIGEPLTRQFVRDAWPELFTPRQRRNTNG